jgi:NADH-quinone oxidoreductase subunit L
MLRLLFLVPGSPLVGFVLLSAFGGRMSRSTIARIGVGSVALSAVVTLLIALSFLISPPPGNVYIHTLWIWMSVAGFAPHISFHLDALSLVMISVVTFVGLLIHLYSADYMIDDPNYSRFFSYMNLFVSMMLILVLADNLLLLYLGWEGVGLCSYLLIGFWYQDPANGRAARKAFIVTRVGDAAMAIGLFMLYDNLGSLEIQELMRRAVAQWPVGSTLAVTAAAMLLGGALGKSAQVPLQIWLPDAMAGPTPVSALIHAATMVTAGVYLIARTHVLFLLAPDVMTVVAVIGAATLLIAGFSALAQDDIKRVLAYSTMSQVGYMFLALGVGAWSAAIFHFMTHAFFKALLFLGAGVIISRLDDEHSMFKMGGLRKELPLTFWTFLIAACSLAALPLITAGFYSKDLILWGAYASTKGSIWLWGAGLAGALLTSLYTFRMVFLTFFGEPHALVKEHSPLPQPGWRINVPLVVLAGLSLVGGLVETPSTLGGVSLFSDLVDKALPALRTVSTAHELTLQIVAALVSLSGVGVAYLLFMRYPQFTASLTESRPGALLHHLWTNGWGFDWLDNEFFVIPFLWFSRKDKNDVIDRLYTETARTMVSINEGLGLLQTGQLRWYAMGIVGGAVLAVAMVVIL